VGGGWVSGCVVFSVLRIRGILTRGTTAAGRPVCDVCQENGRTSPPARRRSRPPTEVSLKTGEIKRV